MATGSASGILTSTLYTDNQIGTNAVSGNFNPAHYNVTGSTPRVMVSCINEYSNGTRVGFTIQQSQTGGLTNLWECLDHNGNLIESLTSIAPGITGVNTIWEFIGNELRIAPRFTTADTYTILATPSAATQNTMSIRLENFIYADTIRYNYNYDDSVPPIPPDLPEKVILRNPPDGSEEIKLNQIFRWYASTNSTEYYIEMSKEVDFSTTVVSQGVGNVLKFQALAALELSEIYFWRVKGLNSAGSGPWSDEWSFDTSNSAVTGRGPCGYVDNKWTFNAILKEDFTGGYFGCAGGQFDNIIAFVCSNDAIALTDIYSVLLRTREGQNFLTTCERINYGKPTPLYCVDEICHAIRWLFCGDKTAEGQLDKVSVGNLVSFTAQTATVESQIGTITIENDYGLGLTIGQKVVIFNEDRKNNFTKVLGPAE